MIAKLTYDHDHDVGLLWNDCGKVIFRACKPEDAALAKKLLTIEKEPTEVQKAEAILNKTELVKETYMAEKAYFSGCWKNGVFQLMKRAKNYSW